MGTERDCGPICGPTTVSSTEEHGFDEIRAGLVNVLICELYGVYSKSKKRASDSPLTWASWHFATGLRSEKVALRRIFNPPRAAHYVFLSAWNTCCESTEMTARRVSTFAIKALAQACAFVSPFLKVNECYRDISPVEKIRATARLKARGLL